MAEIGSSVEPGIVTNVTSALTVSTSGDAPADVGIVGQADLDDGSAVPNEVYQVTRSSDASAYFGTDSLLTEAVTDALNAGAYPVYAVAPAENDVSGEDISGISSTSGTFAEAPITEDPSEVSITVDGTSKTVNKVYDDPSSYSVDTDEAYYNPVEATFEIDAAPSDADNTNDTVAYTSYDYPAAHDAMAQNAGGAVDFFVTLSENLDVKTDAQVTVGNMEGEYNFALAIVGAGARVDPSTYENSFDDSRVQVVYPTRDDEDMSILGSYAGLRASLGISTTPINKRLDAEKSLSVSLNKAERGTLIDQRVVPFADESSGARVADDVNSVSDNNTEEANIRYGFSRLVVDYVLQTVRVNEQPFVGKLNSPAVRAALQGVLESALRPMTRTNAIIDYSVEVRKIDATTASVEFGIETAKPLRFIENEVLVGGVR